MKKIFKTLFDILDDVLAYVLTVVGIIASNYINAMKTGEEITVDIGLWKIVLSAIIALMIVGKGEQLDGEKENEKALSKAGRKKRFWARMSNALSQGVMWSMFINAAGQ